MNTKAIALAVVGIMLISVNLLVVSPSVMSAVEDKLEAAVIWDNETWEDEDWLNGTASRSYYAWNLSNADALRDGSETEMDFERIGPFEYEITTVREVLYHDENNGQLTYSEYNVFEWSGGISADTELTNINILWDPQRIGATETAFDFGTLFMKGYFTRNMLENDLVNRAPSIWVGEDINSEIQESIEAANDASSQASATSALAATNLLNNISEMQSANDLLNDSFAEYGAAVFHTISANDTYVSAYAAAMNATGGDENASANATAQEAANLSLAIANEQLADIAWFNADSAAFSASQNVTIFQELFDTAQELANQFADAAEAEPHRIKSVVLGFENGIVVNQSWDETLFTANDPSDSSICIALTCDIGPMLMVRFGEPDNGTNSIARATMFGYLGADDNETFARDNKIYDEISARFLAHGGGANLAEATHDDLNARLNEITGSEISDVETLQYLLFGWDDGVPAGLLVCESLGVICGATNFLNGALSDPFGTMNDYTKNNSDRFGYSELLTIGADWAGGWFTSDREFELIISSGTGWIDADEWLLEAFGSEDPVTHAYIPLGLNLGGLWGVMYGETVDLDPAASDAILFGEHGLTTSFAMDFLYAEMTGLSVPLDESMLPAFGGTQHVWDDAFVADLYGIDENAASALRWLVKDRVFGELTAVLLEEFLDASPYVTQSVNEWLLGWRDPVLVTLADDSNDVSVGWVSLEKNATYYGCDDDADDRPQDDPHGADGVCSTDSETFITVHTGAVDGLPGQIIMEKGKPYLTWRTPERSEAALGLLETVNQTGAVGKILDANKPALFNLGGYAVLESTVVGADSYKGIPTVNHTIDINPMENLIQAKLIGDESLLDVFPGALPIYFGGTVHLQVEPNLNAIIAIEMNSYFYFDSRGVGAMNPSMDDLVPVFQIQVVSGADDEQAEYIQENVVANVDPIWYWTNFDTGADAMFIDFITFGIYLLANIALLGALGLKIRGRSDQDEFESPYLEDE
jgi:hypothetical protein